MSRYLMAHRRSRLRAAFGVALDGAVFVFVIAVVFVAIWLTAP